MTKVVLSNNCAIELEKSINRFSDEDKISLRYWITFVERNGIILAQMNISFRDHELNAGWSGYRAACFGYSARIIYRIIDSTVEVVEIARITTDHNYKR
ncbi:MAG: hypothetical protein EHM20_12400 [Alphaproteobacteria bacterium]|nr:MAG: hypothetical protein EHM20_12400 [Alphaproteobacteria bacterium]